MFDKLFDILTIVWHALLPWRVLPPWEKAVLVRLGKTKRIMEPGFHWIIPFHIDKVCEDSVVPRTHHIAGQATTTKDGKAIGFDTIITYQISDIEKAVLRVHEVKDAIADTCMGVIGTALSDAAWEDIVHGRVNDELLKLCRARGWRWGIEVMNVQLAGICLVKNVRLSGDRHEHLTG